MAERPWFKTDHVVWNGTDILFCDTDPCAAPAFDCSCNAEPPDTIDIEFNDIEGGSCASCTTYNSTVYTAVRAGTPGPSNACTWTVSGQCGHTLQIDIASGRVDVYILNGFSIVAKFSAFPADPWDCTSHLDLTLFSADNSVCNFQGATEATCSIN